MPLVVAYQLIPTGLCGPYKREEHKAGDDGRQREGNVDYDLDDALAPKAVRTRTHAISVPITAFRAAATR